MPKMVVGEQVEALVDEENAFDHHDHVDQVDRSLELRGFLFVIGKRAHGSMSRPHLGGKIVFFSGKERLLKDFSQL